MELVKQFFLIFWRQDYGILINLASTWSIYVALFLVLFFENGVLLAAFLPGDTLLILIGVLVSKGIMNYFITIFALTLGTCFGGWIGYIQGKLLINSKIIKNWISYLPNNYVQNAYRLFYRYGLTALFVGRFLAFVRTILPIIAGFSGLLNRSFQFFNWISGFLWVFILTTLGYIFGKSLFFQNYEQKIMGVLIFFPIFLFFIGIFGTIILFLKKKFYR